MEADAPKSTPELKPKRRRCAAESDEESAGSEALSEGIERIDWSDEETSAAPGSLGGASQTRRVARRRDMVLWTGDCEVPVLRTFLKEVSLWMSKGAWPCRRFRHVGWNDVGP